MVWGTFSGSVTERLERVSCFEQTQDITQPLRPAYAGDNEQVAWNI